MNKGVNEASSPQIAGRSQAHDSAVEHVTGSARYVDDMENAHGLLHVAIGQSAIAHGELISLNLEKVRQATGVVDVIAFTDLVHATDIGPVYPGDPLLVDKTINHLGQALFAVAATSHRQARQAVLLAQVQYDEQVPLLDIAEAVKKRVFVRPPHSM